MSNIYIQEPPTAGKVLLKTTVGDIDIELWSRESPKACRNFVQLCMEGYYNGTIFHRVVKEFIVQGGDPNGDGTGGESIYGHPFKDEFHSRLRYARRGLVGMANSDVDDNASQFFFTMAATPELQNKNTLFGKVTGDTVFNMLKLEEGLVDHNERPMYPQKILRTEILNNPFPDIVPRTLEKADKQDKTKKKREKGVKNFGLLSFGSEAEEDEEETNDFVQKNAGKAKSMHDVADDPKLSRDTIKIEKTADSSEEDATAATESKLIRVKEDPDEDVSERMKRIKNKLSNTRNAEREKTTKVKKQEDSDSDADVLMTHEHEKRIQNEKKKEEIRAEIQSLKKQYQTDKKQKDEPVVDKKASKALAAGKALKKVAEDNEIIKSFIDEKVKYTDLKAKFPRKGPSREDFTLSMLSKFRSKLDALKHKPDDDDAADDDDAEEATTESTPPPPKPVDEREVEKAIQSDDWLAHTLSFQEQKAPVLAKDASTKGDDWYDVYDPRNPLNQRKRGNTQRSGGGGHQRSGDGGSSKRRR